VWADIWLWGACSFSNLAVALSLSVCGHTGLGRLHTCKRLPAVISHVRSVDLLSGPECSILKSRSVHNGPQGCCCCCCHLWDTVLADHRRSMALHGSHICYKPRSQSMPEDAMSELKPWPATKHSPLSRDIAALHQLVNSFCLCLHLCLPALHIVEETQGLPACAKQETTKP
jgi:hypothetical protein